MAITVRKLVGMPDLRTWVLAGEGGLDRKVGWAHVCELSDPTEWLCEGELVMTTGLGIPEEPAAQVEYVERMAEAGLSGLMVGHRMNAPEFSAEMIEAADGLSLPMLFTAYEVPFTAVARVVAEANRSEEHARLLEILRLYETVRMAALGASGPELLSRLEKIVGCRLHVLDPGRGLSLIRGAPKPRAGIVSALRAASSGREELMPAVIRLRDGPLPSLALAVPSSRPATMVAVIEGESPPDLSLMRHVAAVVALEIEKENAERERSHRLGAELLAGLVDGRLSTEYAVRLLAERGLGDEPRVVAVCAIDGIEAEHSDLHLHLEDRGIPHLLLRRAPLLSALLPDLPGALEGFHAEIGSEVPVGLSDSLGRVSRVPDAQREARWALEGSRAADKPIVRYGEYAPSFFLPPNLGEAERAVRHFLGPLLDYDATHDANLVESLEVFLAHNRSWQKASKALHIHKQTLVYRMRRVEELSGRKLDNTEDVAELWFTLKAAEASSLWRQAPHTGNV